MEYNIVKARTGRDLAVSFLLTAAGIGLFFISKGVGIAIGICGILSFLFLKSGYRLGNTGITFKRTPEDLSRGRKSLVLDYLNRNGAFHFIRKDSESGRMRLDVYYSKSEGIIYAQLFDFRDYDYQPATEVVILKDQQAEQFLSSYQLKAIGGGIDYQEDIWMAS